MFRLCEPLQTVLQADGVCDGGQVQGDVPEGVNGGGDTLAHLTHNIALQLTSEDGVHYAGTLGDLNTGLVDKMSVQ